jgi:hypothetical protein
MASPKAGAWIPAAAVLMLVAGCGSLRQLEVFRVSIVNDTTAPVVVRDCDSYCSSSLLTFDLQPGASVPINRAANMHKLFSVTTPVGGHIGCLDLYYETAQPGAQARVSQATPCPATARPLWKTVGLVLLVVLGVAFVLGGLLRRRRASD